MAAKKVKQNREIEPAPKHAGGRPSIYSPELADKICELISTSTKGIVSLCREHAWLPSHDTIHKWRLKRSEFSDQYDNAKKIQADLLVEDMLDIGDNVSPISDNVSKARLQIDTRKWIACKLLPKVYGERIQNDVTATVKHEDTLGFLK